MDSTELRVMQKMDEAKAKALDSLGRYKFSMFGYWSAQWVLLNKVLPRDLQQPNPFKFLVDKAREMSA